ncbi:MAG: hypothetical protein IPK28_08705 [Devosia sp.]|nr:hypothetical protein [Devosia sp.]
MTPLSILRAAILGVALVVSSSLPAVAAPLQFQFGIGTDGFGFRRPLICIELTDHQIRAAVRAHGYRNIYLNVRNDRRIQVRATRGDWVYLLRVSTCTGAILDRDRLRPA